VSGGAGVRLGDRQSPENQIVRHHETRNRKKNNRITDRRRRTLGYWNHSVSALDAYAPLRWSRTLDIHCGVDCALVTQLQRRPTAKSPRSRDGRSHPFPDRVRLGILDRPFATAERDLRALITGYSAVARKRRAMPTCRYKSRNFLQARWASVSFGPLMRDPASRVRNLPPSWHRE